jgi:hypothetical protein
MPNLPKTFPENYKIEPVKWLRFQQEKHAGKAAINNFVVESVWRSKSPQ